MFPGNEQIEGKELVLEWFDGEMLPARPTCKRSPA